MLRDSVPHRKRVSLYAKTPEKLFEKVKKAEQDIEDAVFYAKTPTVNDYCEKWLLMQSGRLRSTTIADYRWKVKKYIQEPLGRKLMVDVTPDDVKLSVLPALQNSESIYRSTQMLYKLIFASAVESHKASVFRQGTLGIFLVYSGSTVELYANFRKATKRAAPARMNRCGPLI